MIEETSNPIQLNVVTYEDSHISTGITGLPYIEDTNYTYEAGQSFKVAFQYIGATPPTNNYSHLISSQVGNSVSLNITFTDYNSTDKTASLEVKMGTAIERPGVDLYSKHVLELNYNSVSNKYSIKFDNLIIGTITPSSYTGTALTFFQKNISQKIEARQGYFKFYGLEISKNGVLQYNYVPNQNGTLLETVNNRTLSNSGTGTITYVEQNYESGDIDYELFRIQQAKEDIKTAVQGKNVSVGNGTIDTYASKIADIAGITPSGSLQITQNNVYNVTNYASVDVQVQGSGSSAYNAQTGPEWGNTRFMPMGDQSLIPGDLAFGACWEGDLMSRDMIFPPQAYGTGNSFSETLSSVGGMEVMEMYVDVDQSHAEFEIKGDPAGAGVTVAYIYYSSPDGGQTYNIDPIQSIFPTVVAFGGFPIVQFENDMQRSYFEFNQSQYASEYMNFIGRFVVQRHSIFYWNGAAWININ